MRTTTVKPTSALSLAALVAVLALGATACGSADETTPTAAPTAAKTANGTSTRPAACATLTGPHGLVSRALAFTEPMATSDPVGYTPGVNPETGTPIDKMRVEVQDGLFEVVVSGGKQLEDPAGELVDFLDDPATYVSSKDLSARVQRASATITTICGG